MSHYQIRWTVWRAILGSWFRGGSRGTAGLCWGCEQTNGRPGCCGGHPSVWDKHTHEQSLEEGSSREWKRSRGCCSPQTVCAEGRARRGCVELHHLHTHVLTLLLLLLWQVHNKSKHTVLDPALRLRIKRHHFLFDSYPEHRLRSWLWSYYSG